MTWKSHIAIATAITLPFNPLYVPFAILGSTAPDWSEWILHFFGIRVQHRGATHYLYIPILFIVVGAMLDVKPIVWFGVGYLSHWFADSLTLSGVPLSQWDSHRIHFFGGKIRTGDYQEYIISFGILIVAIIISQSSIININPFVEHNQTIYKNNNFNPYWIPYAELYEDKIIDEKTYRDNKFKLF